MTTRPRPNDSSLVTVGLVLIGFALLVMVWLVV